MGASDRGGGEKGPIVHAWARQRGVERHEGLPGEAAWLLVRRSVKDPTDMAHYLSNAPKKTPLLTLAEGATARWTIEQCVREAKSETGLDEYEVRLWHSWYRHTTLVMMAPAWLASMRSRLGQKSGLCAQAMAPQSSTLPTQRCPTSVSCWRSCSRSPPRQQTSCGSG
jgi:hypothetical protein